MSAISRLFASFPMHPQLSFQFVYESTRELRPAGHVVTAALDERATTLYVCDSLNYIALTDDQVIDYAKRLLGLSLQPGRQVLQTPAAIRDFLRLRLSRLDYEVFGCLYLDTRHRLIEMEELFRGTINTAAVYPREVVKAVIRCAASTVVVYHNHPSGVAEPSPADENITKRLKEALALIDVVLLDHLIVADLGTFSFSEHGRL